MPRSSRPPETRERLRGFCVPYNTPAVIPCALQHEVLLRRYGTQGPQARSKRPLVPESARAADTALVQDDEASPDLSRHRLVRAAFPGAKPGIIKFCSCAREAEPKPKDGVIRFAYPN